MSNYKKEKSILRTNIDNFNQHYYVSREIFMRIMQRYAHIKRKGGNMINIRLRKCVTRARISQSRRRKPLIADLRRCCRHWIARKKAANIFRDLHLSTHDVSRKATSAKSCKSPTCVNTRRRLRCSPRAWKIRFNEPGCIIYASNLVPITPYNVNGTKTYLLQTPLEKCLDWELVHNAQDYYIGHFVLKSISATTTGAERTILILSDLLQGNSPISRYIPPVSDVSPIFFAHRPVYYPRCLLLR